VSPGVPVVGRIIRQVHELQPMFPAKNSPGPSHDEADAAAGPGMSG
jgi:hypothetical protein